MYRIGIVAILAAIGSVALAGWSQAASVTVTDVVDLDTGGVMLSNVSQVSLDMNGSTYLNFTGANSGGLTPSFVVGTTVHSVSATVLSSAVTNGVASSLSGDGPTGGDLVGIIGIRGTVIDASAANPTTLFTAGRIRVVEITADTFNPTELSTWNFNGANVLAEYSLKGPEDIVSGTLFDPDGPGGVPLELARNFSRPASDVNIGAANIDITGDLQTLLLFQEDPPPQTLMDTTGFLGPILLGSGFVTEIENESLIINAAQNILGTTHGVLSPGDQTILDAISAWAFGSPFADFGAGDFDDFIVSPGFAGAGGPDFIADTGGLATPGLQGQTVPEPTSVAIWCLIGGAISSFVVLRRYKRNS